MKITLLRKMIKETAAEAECTEIEIITAMQGECAKRKDETTLGALIDIKNEYLTEAGIL